MKQDISAAAAHATFRTVLEIEAAAIRGLVDRIDPKVEEALRLLLDCQGRVVTTGMGKSGIICRKISATLASTGTPSLFLHPAEAIHGDLGMIASGDVVLALSNSGETAEILDLLKTIRRLGIPLIALVGNPASSLAQEADIVFDVSVDREACNIGVAPTASTTAALAWGDALAISLSECKGFHIDDFARLHPGGGLGKRLAHVGDLMHTGDAIPKVLPGAPMTEAIYEMTGKTLGVTAVVDEVDRLLGVISDGDLRRLLQRDRGKILDHEAGACMTSEPCTIGSEELAVSALRLLEERKITSLMVTNADGRLIGVLHLHDLWRTQVI